MNNTCSGQSFKIKGQWFWRCLQNGTVIENPNSNVILDKCPVCGRPVTREIVEVETRVLIIHQARAVNSPYWFELKTEVF